MTEHTSTRRSPDYRLFGVIALGPLLPLAGIGLRRYPRFRFPVIFALSGGILATAHYWGVETSVNSK